MSDADIPSQTDCTRSQTETASQRVEACVSRIAARDGTFHAVSRLFEDQARQRAAHLDAIISQGKPPGKLHGVPYLTKEPVDIEGYFTQFGSSSYATSPAKRDAPAIARLNAAGANLIGTTHMVEFAFGSWGTNYLMGTPWNPCDLTQHRVPGGSSSGSAVAVAAGYVPVAIGSDTGGSIRIPASLCGVIGFKPSNGLIPTTGVAPLGPTFDTLGPMTRTVEHARSFTEVMADTDLSHPPVEIEGLQIAVLSPEALSPCEPEIEQAFRDTVSSLQARGAKVSEIDLPLSLVEFQKLNGEIVGYEAFARLKSRVEDWRLPMDPYVRQRVRSNGGMDRQAYDIRLAQLAQVRSEFAHLFSGFDILALPGTPFRAPLMSEVNEAEIPMSRYTRVANCLDLCAITLPLPDVPGGLPIGFQLCTGTGNDAFLLALAESVLSTVQKN